MDSAFASEGQLLTVDWDRLMDTLKASEVFKGDSTTDPLAAGGRKDKK